MEYNGNSAKTAKEEVLNLIVVEGTELGRQQVLSVRCQFPFIQA